MFSSCPNNVTVIVENATEGGASTVVVEWPTPEVSDDSGIVASLSCNPESGVSFSAGLTTVVCEAGDASGNKANCSFVVIVGEFLAVP